MVLMWPVGQHLLAQAAMPHRWRKLRAGDVCRIEYLQGQVALNGKVGIIGEMDYARGRWPITVAKSDDGSEPMTISVRRHNLVYYGCEKCGQRAPSMCSRCQAARYCSADCQKAHFPEHKKVCVKSRASAASSQNTSVSKGINSSRSAGAATPQCAEAATTSADEGSDTNNPAVVTVTAVNGSGQKSWHSAPSLNFQNKTSKNFCPGEVKKQSGLKTSRPGCHRIVVKLQASLIEPRAGIFAYNKDGTYVLYINAPEASLDPNPHWDALRIFIREYGGMYGGVKIFLFCDYNPVSKEGFFELVESSVVPAGKWTKF
jgi:hypothetical protein